MKATIILLLIWSITLCYVTNNYSTNQSGGSYFTNGNSNNCNVGVNGDLVGFYCPDQKYLFYYK